MPVTSGKGHSPSLATGESPQAVLFTPPKASLEMSLYEDMVHREVQVNAERGRLSASGKSSDSRCERAAEDAADGPRAAKEPVHVDGRKRVKVARPGRIKGIAQWNAVETLVRHAPPPP